MQSGMNEILQYVIKILLDIMRNTSWNCSPTTNKDNFTQMMGSNETGLDVVELRNCQNDGECVAFELTDVHGEKQKGYKCQCPEGFR